MAMNPLIRDWAGKRVWLVGASSGIGAEMARQLAVRGARIALSGRNREVLEALGLHEALLLPCDANDTGALAACRQAMLARWGGIDLVIYLAGDYVPMGAKNFAIETAERLFAVNFTAAAKLTGCVLKDLPAGGGIAFVASVAGYRGLPKAIAYGPGKAALIHFAECLYLDLAPEKIGVWLINPGFVATRLTARNDFSMPALLTVEQAAEATLAGFAAGGFEIHYPKRFTRLLKLLSLLPYRWYFPLIRRITGA